MEAELSLVLDSEFISTGSTTVRSSDSPRPQRNSSSGHLVFVNESQDAALPNLLNKIFKPSRISLIFTAHHRVLLQLLNIPDLNDTSQNAPPLTTSEELNDDDDDEQCLGNISRAWLFKWFDLEHVSSNLSPVCIALDDIISCVLDRLISRSEFKILPKSEQKRRATVLTLLIDLLYETPEHRTNIIKHISTTTKLSKMAIGYALSLYSRPSDSNEDENSEPFNHALFLSLENKNKNNKNNKNKNTKNKNTKNNQNQDMNQDDPDPKYVINNPKRDKTCLKTNQIHVPGYRHLLSSIPPIHLAVLVHSIQACQLFDAILINHKDTSDKNTSDIDPLGNSAFHIYAILKYDTMKLAIEMGETLMNTKSARLINVPNKRGQSPLHIAAVSGSRGPLCWFLEQGIQVDSKIMKYLSDPTSLDPSNSQSPTKRNETEKEKGKKEEKSNENSSRQHRSKSSLILHDVRRFEHRYGTEGPSWPFLNNYTTHTQTKEGTWRNRPRMGYPMQRSPLDAALTATASTSSITINSPLAILRLAHESRNMSNTFLAIAPLSSLSSSPRSRKAAATAAVPSSTSTSTSTSTLTSPYSLEIHELMLKMCIQNNDFIGCLTSINRGASVRLLEAYCLEHEQNIVLFDQDADLIDAWLPLHSATAASNSDIIQLLVAKGASLKLKSRIDGTTVLHHVSMGSKQLRTSSNSGNHGFRSRTMSKEDIDDLMHEKRRLHANEQIHRNSAMDTARTLLELGADADALDSKGRTPLHVAIIRGDYVYAQLLVSFGARPGLMAGRGIVSRVNTTTLSNDINTIVGGGGGLSSPLHMAVSSNQLLCLRVMLFNIGSGGLATCRKFQLGDDIGEAAMKVDTPTKQNRKRSKKSKKKNTPIPKTRQRAQTSDEMPTSSIDQKGNTPLGIAVVRLNCTAVGILANSGARFDQGKESPMSKLGMVFLDTHLPTCKSYNPLISEISLKLLVLCVSNGATPMVEERHIFNCIKDNSETATTRLSEALEINEARDTRQVKYVKEKAKTTLVMKNEPLLFWCEPGNFCWGISCLEKGLTERYEMKYCTSCGLQFCQKCCSKKRWEKIGSVWTVSGEKFKSCLCTGCSVY